MFGLKNESKRLKAFVFLLLIIFCFISIFTGLYYNDELLLGSFEKFNNDDVKYIRSANTLIETGKFTYNYPTSSTAFIMPGIVFTLAPFVKFFGIVESVTYFRIFSTFIQTLILYIIFLISLKMFNKKIAILTLILNSIYVPHLYVSNLVLTETMFSFFLSLLILVSIHAIESKKIKYYISGGILLGLAILFRPSIALYPIIIFIIWCKEKYKLKEMVKFAIVTMIFCILILSPWWIRNYIVFDRFIPFTLSSGNPMLQGAFINNDVNHELIAKLNTENLFYTNDEVINNEVESKIAKKVYLYYFKNNFWEYLKWNSIDKTLINFETPYYGFEIYGISHKLVISQHIIYMSLGIFGAVIKTSRKLIIVLIPVYFALIHLPFLAYSRYMYPICAYMIMLMASIVLKEDKASEKDTCYNSGI